AFRLGADWEVIAGSYRETWLRTFSDSGLVTSRDTLEVKYPRKGRFRIGAQLTRKDWAVGAVFETSQSLPVEQRRSTPGAVDFLPSRRMIYPTGLVVGGSAPLGERLRAVAQYRRANWRHSSLESDFV